MQKSRELANRVFGKWIQGRGEAARRDAKGWLVRSRAGLNGCDEVEGGVGAGYVGAVFVVGGNNALHLESVEPMWEKLCSEIWMYVRWCLRLLSGMTHRSGGVAIYGEC